MPESKSTSTREIIAAAIAGTIIIDSAIYWFLQIIDAVKLIIQNGGA